MEIEKIRKWLEITNQYRQTDFWSSVLQLKSPEEFFNDTENKPSYDLYQNEYYNFVIIEIPGVNNEDVILKLISSTQLFISGTIKPIFPMETELKRERTYGKFERIIELSEATEAHLLNKQLFNGLLLISYPRNSYYRNQSENMI